MGFSDFQEDLASQSQEVINTQVGQFGLRTPNVRNHTHTRAFLSELVRINQGNFSHRKFAREIGWPLSLLGDLMAGRRGLSIARAVELARYFKMTGIETERLIMFALRDVESPEVQAYVDNFIAKEGTNFPQPSEDQLMSPERRQHQPGGVTYFSPEHMADFNLGALHMFLHWCGGKATPDDVARFLYLNPALKDPEVLDEKLETLRELGFIKGDWPEFTLEQPNVATSGMTRAQVLASIESLRPLAETKARRIHWQVSRVVFPMAKYTELNQRFTALWNWIKNTCLDERAEAVDKRNDHVVLQVNTLVTHLLDLDELGVDIQTDLEKGHALVKK